METFLTYWGAAIATILAGVRLYEFWRARPHIFLRHHLTTDPMRGNQIILDNPTGHTYLIEYWELVRVRRKYLNFFRIEDEVQKPDDEDIVTIVLKPNSSKTLEFTQWQHFDWGVSERDKGKLYLKISLSGKRKPINLLVEDLSKATS